MTSTTSPVLAQQQASPAWWRSLARPIGIAALALVGLVILRRIPLTVEVVIVAILLAYGLNPPIVGLSKKLPRRTAVAVVFTAFICVLLAMFLIVIPAVVGQLQKCFSNSADYISVVQSWVTQAREWINNRVGIQVVPSQLQSLSAQVSAVIASMLQTGLGQVGAAVIFTIHTLVVIFTAVVLSYYFLANSGGIKESFLDLFPERNKATALYFTQEVERVFGAYIGGQVILVCFCAVFSVIGLKLAGSNYALLLGVLTGLLYVIPYVGVTLAILLGALFGLLQSWHVAAWSVAVVFIITRIADTVVVPKVMSKSVGVSPAGVMLAVFAGGEMFGLWGLLLAIPAAAILKVVWITWVRPWLAGSPRISGQAVASRSQTDAM